VAAPLRLDVRLDEVNRIRILTAIEKHLLLRYEPDEEPSIVIRVIHWRRTGPDGSGSLN
jgi:hypothetical protein